MAETSETRAASDAAPPEFDQPEFVNRLTQAVRHAADGGRTLRVRLHPPELGMLQVEVALRDGALAARLEVQTPAARQILLDSLGQLREALAQTGTAVERIDVQLTEPRAPESRSDAQDRRERDQPHQEGSRDRRRDSQQHPEPEDDAPSLPHPSGLDELDVEI